MSEKTMALTTYQFGGNNPVSFNDPSGLLVHDPGFWHDQHELADKTSNWNDIDNTFAEIDHYDKENGIGTPPSPDGVSKGTGSYDFYGKAAKSAFKALLNAYNRSDDGDWSFSVDTHAGAVGFYEPNYDKYSTEGNTVTVTTQFISWQDYFDSGGPGDGKKTSTTPDNQTFSLKNFTNTMNRYSLSFMAGTDFYIQKSALSNAPKWLVGPYSRSISMDGATEYTSILSIQMRRLGWQHGGRFLQDGAAYIAFATLTYDNLTYYKDIIDGKQNFQQVQDHYNDVTINPIFWAYKKIEPWLISLGNK
jgi:hypothetical protein